MASQLEQLKLLPSSPAGRAIGYRQTMEYLMRSEWRRGDVGALKEYIQGFAAVSRRYAQQQTKWFRSEQAFEWLPVDWEHPTRTVEIVAARIALDRDDYAKGLQSAEQARQLSALAHVNRSTPDHLPHRLACPHSSRPCSNF